MKSLGYEAVLGVGVVGMGQGHTWGWGELAWVKAIHGGGGVGMGQGHTWGGGSWYGSRSYMREGGAGMGKGHMGGLAWVGVNPQTMFMFVIFSQSLNF